MTLTKHESKMKTLKLWIFQLLACLFFLLFTDWKLNDFSSRVAGHTSRSQLSKYKPANISNYREWSSRWNQVSACEGAKNKSCNKWQSNIFGVLHSKSYQWNYFFCPSHALLPHCPSCMQNYRPQNYKLPSYRYLASQRI